MFNRKLKFKYFNNFYTNYFLNMFIRGGNSKKIKKLYLKIVQRSLFKLNFLKKTSKLSWKKEKFNKVLKNYIKHKKLVVFFFGSTRKTFVNHQKKFISSYSAKISSRKKRNFFFIKFLRFFFRYKNWKKNINNFVMFDLGKIRGFTYNLYTRSVARKLIKR